MNYRRFLNKVSLSRKESPIRALTALLASSPKDTISLAGGMPNPGMFPFESAEIKLKDGSSLSLEGETMTSALQYGPTPGFPPLVKWLKELQTRLHNPPTLQSETKDSSFDLIVTTGVQDGLSKTFDMLLSPGDRLLIDSPTYTGTLYSLYPLDCVLESIQTDSSGMIPELLISKLEKLKADNETLPKALYTIPNGGNPTGASLSLERKQKIYKIAQEYDLLILEDDPYYFLTFKKIRTPSFLSMDTDGRVLRFDSFSKILSSGMRIGYCCGPSFLINQIKLHNQVSVLHPSSLSQVILMEYFKKVNYSGFEKHISSVVEFYLGQRNAMQNSAKKWLTGLAEWCLPEAGMFFWFKLFGVNDTKDLILTKAIKRKVMFVPGLAFMEDPDEASPYVRASFSLATPEQMDQAFERLANLIKEERNMR